MITADDLLDQRELASLLGVAESSLRAMRSQADRHRRIDGLPDPIRLVGQAPVWDRRAVLAWLQGREPERLSAADVWAALDGCADAGADHETVDDVVYR